MTPLLSLRQARRIALRAQGFAARNRKGSLAEVAAAIRRLSCVQLDSISTVERSHRIVLASRVGAHPRDALDKLLAQGNVVEYWAHEACIVPVEDWPLFRRRMRERSVHHWWGDVIGEDRPLARAVLRAIEKNGPMASRDFDGAGGGGMWNLKPEKRMLDALWTAGKLVVSRRDGFQRRYDLPERVLLAKVLDAPVPTEAAMLEGLARRAIAGRGILTERGILEHYRLTPQREGVRKALGRLEKRGEVQRVELSDEGAHAFVLPETDLDPPPPTAAVLISPFDNLLWDRPFARRVLEFDHLIEVYKKEHDRRYGYYVLPLVMGDSLVGRADLKSDRDAKELRMRAFHREKNVSWTSAHDDALATALERLARNIGLERVAQ